MAIKSPYEKNLREQLTWDLRTSQLPNVNYFYENKQFSLTVDATQKKNTTKTIIYKFPFGAKLTNEGVEFEKDSAGRVIYNDENTAPSTRYRKKRMLHLQLPIC